MNQPVERRLEWWLIFVVVATVAACAVLGVVSALVGGPLTALGAGPGGLWGLPLVVLFAAVFVGFGLAFRTLRRGDRRSALVLGFGPLLVLVAFQLVAHVLDPCALGAWTAASDLAGSTACERFGSEVSIATRFHLALHGLVAAPVAFVVTKLFRR